MSGTREHNDLHLDDDEKRSLVVCSDSQLSSFDELAVSEYSFGDSVPLMRDICLKFGLTSGRIHPRGAIGRTNPIVGLIRNQRHFVCLQEYFDEVDEDELLWPNPNYIYKPPRPP